MEERALDLSLIDQRGVERLMETPNGFHHYQAPGEPWIR